MEKEKVKVIFRKAKNPYTNEYEVIAFFPEIKATHYRILCYQHIGQHSEADISYYKWETKKATKEEYDSLLNELKRIYDDCILVVKEKLYWNDLKNKAWNW